MQWFIEIENLEKLENEEKWEEIRIMLHEKWINDKENLGLLIRLATLCWYICSEWGCCFDNIGLNYEDFKNDLIETTEYGLKHFYDNYIFLCIFGYMISLSPHLFYKGKDTNKLYTEWENKGKEMQKQAYEICPEDPVVKILYRGTISNNTKEYIKAIEELTDDALEIFTGNTEIEEYFKHVLTFKNF